MSGQIQYFIKENVSNSIDLKSYIGAHTIYWYYSRVPWQAWIVCISVCYVKANK